MSEFKKFNCSVAPYMWSWEYGEKFVSCFRHNLKCTIENFSVYVDIQVGLLQCETDTKADFIERLYQTDAKSSFGSES